VVHRDELDDAIDAAVREIMSGESPAGLRQRVLRRITSPERPAAPVKPRLALAGGFALSACLVVAVLMLWSRQPAPTPQAPASAAAARQQNGSASTAPAAIARPMTVKPSPAPRAGIVSRAERRENAGAERMVTATSLVEPDDAVAIAPLETVKTIEATAVDPRPVDIDDIEVAPLRIEPLRVEPLSTTPR
jgi:hypothetical protein